jgi:hypothetical protein
MLQHLLLVQLINNLSNKTKSMAILSQKVLNQLVEELQELIFMIYSNLELKFWRMFSQKKLKGNGNKTINTIHLIYQYKLLVKPNKNSLTKNQFLLSKKILFNNLLNQFLIKLCSSNRNKFKISNQIRIFPLNLNSLFNLKWRFLYKMFNLNQ